MTKDLRNLLKFIVNNKPEIHIKENGTDDVIMIVTDIMANEFLQICNFIDDEGYGMFWKGYYFAIDLNDFLENECDISVEDFALIVGCST